jgi:hypothetical protein
MRVHMKWHVRNRAQLVMCERIFVHVCILVLFNVAFRGGGRPRPLLPSVLKYQLSDYITKASFTRCGMDTCL